MGLRRLLTRHFLRLFRKPSIVGILVLSAISFLNYLFIQSNFDGQTFSAGLSPYDNKVFAKRLFKHTTAKTALKHQNDEQSATAKKSFYERHVASRYPTSPTGPSTTPSESCDFKSPLAKDKRYVVFSCKFTFYKNPENDCLKNRDYNSPCACAFSLPIAAASWRRFDYDAIVFLLTDAEGVWKKRKAFDYVIDTLNTVTRVHVFVVPIEQHGHDDRLLIQAIRFFAAKYLKMIQPNATNKSNPYIVTSESYLYPSSLSNKNLFEIPADGSKDILAVLPFGWNEHFYFDNELVKILPASFSLGMRATNWREIMKYNYEFEDVIQEIRIFGHRSLASAGGFHGMDPRAVEKAFAAHFYTWLKDDSSSKLCRIEERNMEQIEKRVFRLPLAIQSVNIWRNVREMIRAQVGPADVLDIENYYHGFIQAVGSEAVMEAPTMDATKQKAPRASENFDPSVQFLPLNRMAGRMKPYRGLNHSIDIETFKAPEPWGLHHPLQQPPPPQ